MIYIKVKNLIEGDQYLAQALLRALSENSKVVWLVSGGSNIEIAVRVRRAIPDEILTNLTVMLVDERYGEAPHKDSNYYKLEQAGFDFKRVNFEPILTKPLLSLARSVNNYQRRLQRIFSEADKIIGQFGIGADGHTGGILPHSEACIVDDRLVIGYQGPDFERITLSFTAIKLINEAYIFAFGDDKRSTLGRLHDEDQPLSDQPAQIFRQYAAKSFIINNMIGD